MYTNNAKTIRRFLRMFDSNHLFARSARANRSTWLNAPRAPACCSPTHAQEARAQVLRTCLQSRGTPPEYPYFCAKNKSEHDAYRDMESARRSFAAKN